MAYRGPQQLPVSVKMAVSPLFQRLGLDSCEPNSRESSTRYPLVVELHAAAILRKNSRLSLTME